MFLANAQRSRAADAVTARCNSGKLRIYSGSVPANADAALGAAVLLAELTFGATAYGAAASGVAAVNAITQDSAADADGTATFFRTFETDGSTPVFQGTVSESGGGGELVLVSTAIGAGVPVSVSSLTYTQPAG